MKKDEMGYCIFLSDKSLDFCKKIYEDLRLSSKNALLNPRIYMWKRNAGIFAFDHEWRATRQICSIKNRFEFDASPSLLKKKNVKLTEMEKFLMKEIEELKKRIEENAQTSSHSKPVSGTEK